MTVCRLKKLDILGLNAVSGILYSCGQNMAEKYDLHHWDNSHLNTWAILVYCLIKYNIHICIYLVYKDDRPVATFQVRKTGNALQFYKLATLPQYEGQGIGSFCIEQIETIGREFRCSAITCEVYAESKHAICFYEHNGFEKVGTKRTRKYEEVIMKKSL